MHKIDFSNSKHNTEMSTYVQVQLTIKNNACEQQYWISLTALAKTELQK